MSNALRESAQRDPWLVVTGDVVVGGSRILGDPRLAALLEGAAVSFGNLEVPLTRAPVSAEKAATLRADPECAHDVRKLGLDVVTLANNHLLDCGPEGLHETRAALDAAGVAHVGAGRSVGEALRFQLRGTDAGPVALLGLCSALPVGFAATAERAGVAPVRVLQQVAMDPALAAEQPGMAPYVHTTAHGPDVDAALAAVAAARTEADLVVVGIHWGVPYGFAPASYGPLADYQQPLGRALVDAGADLVVGHHPHVVQPVERYHGGLIAYSLGNFMFQGWDTFAPSGRSEEETRFRLGVPAAPYRSVFGDPVTHDSALLVLPRPVAGHPRVVRFVPTTMVDGLPVVPDDAHGEAILRRLVDHSFSGEAAGDQDLTIRHDTRTGLLIGEATL